MDPTIVIAAKGAGPAAVLTQLESIGVEVQTYEQAIYSMAAWRELITRLGNDFDRGEQAARLIGQVSKGIRDQVANRTYQDKRINAVALLSVGQRGPVAAGQNTVPNLLLELAGITNLAHEVAGYKPFSTELLAQKKIDLVLIPSHVIAGLGGKQAVCDNPVLKQAMSKRCSVYVMDGLLLLGFGARLDQAVGKIIRQANAL